LWAETIKQKIKINFRKESRMERNILVTGGAGYIGSLLVGLLLKNNDRVTVFDNLTYGGGSLLNYWQHPNFTFVKGDVTDFATTKSLVLDKRIDTIVHLAAIVGDPACAKHSDLARKINWEASLALLELSINNNIKRFVFASTCSNYGKMSDPDSYVDEKSTLAPLSLYAELKVRMENVILHEIEKKEKFCPTSLRFSTVYGLSSRMRFDLTVNQFSKELVMGRELEVFGEQFWRPYCHVYDIARAIVLVLNSGKEDVAYNVFNVGDTGENFQKQMIVEEIRKVIPDATIKYVLKKEDPRDYRVSFEKIQNELGFHITRVVSDGVEEVIRGIKEGVIRNPDDKRYFNV